VIWLSRRQFRAQAIVAAVALVVAGAGLLTLGIAIRREPYVRCAGGCADRAAEFQDKWVNLLYFVDAGLLVLPVLIGIFWGAPLVAREWETGTHRLVWNQSVTRSRWLAVKLLTVAGAGALFAAAFTALLTWAAAPYDQVAGDRFSRLVFGVRAVAPVGYAVFAVVLGAVLGLLLRRTLRAMSLAALLLILVQVLVPTLLRPHYLAPASRAVPMTAAVVSNLRFLGSDADISGLTVPGAMVVSTSRILGPDGRLVDLGRYHACVSRSPENAPACIQALDAHVDVEYHPAGRYWTFQLLELTLYLALSALLAGAAFVRLRSRR
jgi:hypothetical protein